MGFLDRNKKVRKNAGTCIHARCLKKVLCVALCVGTLVMTGCGEDKEPISADTFEDTMEAAGLIINDETESDGDIFGVEQILVAYSEDGYQIEYYLFENEADATQLYNYVTEDLEINYSDADVVAKSRVSFEEYGKYTIAVNGEYYVVSRIGNTLVYATALEEYKDVTKDLVESLGY